MLGISQPPLSQQIQRLEREIGTPLFRRLSRGVELTEAGQSFYEDACLILELSDNALEKTRGIARGLNGRLSIGITSSDVFHPKIFSLIRQFQVIYPAITINQVEGNMTELMVSLSEAELDLAFIRLPCENSKVFNLRILDEEPMMIALHRSHPLSVNTSLRIEQLQELSLILFPSEISPELYELVYSRCLRAGINMEQTYQSSQLCSSLSMVEAGFGFALVPQSMSCVAHSEVSYHPIEDFSLKTTIALAWRRFERSQTVKRFLNMP